MQAGDAWAATTAAGEQLKNPAPAPHGDSHADCRILVVDDNPINCAVAVQMLQKLGCQVEATCDSRDAIEMHARHRFDLILLDCQMPGLDGYQTTALIRATDSGRALRTAVIGWTSPSDADARAKCIDAGMDDMIFKPIERNAIREIIARWAASPTTPGQRQARDEDASDLAAVQQRFGPAFPELAALFQADTQKRIEIMRTAAAAENLMQVAAIAHVLGGSCASIGALQLAGMCRELELCCKGASAQNVDSLLGQIEARYSETKSHITALLQSATP